MARNIRVTPKSTADRKPGRKPKPQAPAPVENPQDLQLWDAYQRAVASGNERRFLRQHPGFKARSGATMPPKSGLGRINSDAARVGQVQKAAEKGAVRQSQEAIQMQNAAEYQTDTGTASTYIDPATGRAVHKVEGSEPQKQILSGAENLTLQGQGLASQNLGNYEAFNWQGSPEERARIEEEVYGRMTRNVDRDYQKEFNDMEQRMYMRGIPLDPSNQAYKDQLDALNEKYGQIKENARSQAVQMGGEEMARSFGVGLGSQQQRMAETAALQKMGSGYIAPTDPGFQAPEFQQTNVADLWLQRRGQNFDKEVGMKGAEAAMMNAQANMMSASKAGGSEEEGIPT